MNVALREKALGTLIARRRDDQCGRLLEAARGEAQALRRQAHGEARGRLHRAVVKERGRARARIQALHAKLRTQRRMARQRASFAVIEAGWKRLEVELPLQWRDPGCRRIWVETAVARGLDCLPRDAWLIRHPAAWDPAEQRGLIARLAPHLQHPPRLQADPTILAGLSIISGLNSLDATVRGLLADRGAVESRLLALMG